MSKKKTRANTTTMPDEQLAAHVAETTDPSVTMPGDDDDTPTICAPGHHKWERYTNDWSRCSECFDRQLTKYLET